MDIRFDISVGGVTYPCVLTMGARMEFKDARGHEMDDATEDDIPAIIYFCARSGAIRGGNALPFTLATMPHMQTLDESTAAITAYVSAVMAYAEQKKTTADAAAV